ncbi:MAG TPA: hypothetical protein VEL11_03890 [Candidatus Bathyarchaeia archaeon]|nr:hypothetical protein [Candidatus Bathyarchaeia archaeon]
MQKHWHTSFFYTQAVRVVWHRSVDENTPDPAKDARVKDYEETYLVRRTWDAENADEIKPLSDDHIVIRRRDSAFHDTEIEV